MIYQWEHSLGRIPERGATFRYTYISRKTGEIAERKVPQYHLAYSRPRFHNHLRPHQTRYITSLTMFYDELSYYFDIPA